MVKVTNVLVEYEPPDTIEVQGKREKIEKYLKKGYSVKEERNGYWVLIKKAKVWVTLTNSYCTKTFSMKSDILDYYGKQKISTNLVGKFQKDINDGKITFTMDKDGTSYNMK